MGYITVSRVKSNVGLLASIYLKDKANFVG